MNDPSNHTPSTTETPENISETAMPRKKILFFSVILYLLFFSDFVSRIGVNTLYPLIQTELGLSDQQIGLLTSIVMLTMTLFVLPFSYFTEKISKRKAITVMSMVWSLATLLTGFAKSFPLLLIGRAGVGVGNSAYAPTSVSMLTSWYDKKKWGKVLGLYNTAMVVGAAGGAMICGFLAQSTGWRTTLFIIGGVSLGVSLLTLFMPDGQGTSEDQEAAKKKVSLKETVHLLLGNQTLMVMCLGGGLLAMINYALAGFVSIFYVREMGMNMVQVGSLMGLSGIIGAISFPLGGTLLDFWYAKDKRARMWLPAICALLAGISYFVAFSMKLWPMIPVASFLNGFITTAFHSASQELVPKWNKAVSYGIYVTITTIFGVIGPILTGFLSAQFGLVITLSGLQIFSAIVTILLLFASRTYLRDYENSRTLEASIDTGNHPLN